MGLQVHRWGWRVLRGGVVVIVAVVCWVLFVADHHVDDRRMAVLAVSRAPIPQVRARPVTARTLPVSASTVALVRGAAKEHPDATGIYEVGWQSPSSAKITTNAGLLVQLLPTDREAASVLASVRREYSSSHAVGGATYRLTGHFAVPGVPGARGGVYRITVPPSTGSSGTTTATADVATFRVGRVAVLELLQSTGATIGPPSAVALARDERVQLVRHVAGFTLGVVTRPLGWTVALFAGAVVAGLGVAVLPEWAVAWRGRRRLRREHARHERATAELRAVGRRTVRRHQAPAWQRRAAHGHRTRRWWGQ